ncbi:HCLS1-associated protein X-1 [Boleophthalmus pectinirostris]|uniref:HCLS1-associated protein X-1 n=1 Tax=Boleophthalmus pectinirostris TaxID=150288 RepID=UPI002431CCF8|nr:HCLS1-associated protein X-1 [Boleophthalmus pectinirostris]
MSVFDLFRGFFGVPGGQYRGRRDPFFEAMTHDEDDDEDEDEDGFYYDGFRGEQQDPFDSAWRFGFSLGPDGMRFQEPPVFGQLLKEMEEMFSQMGRFDGHSEPGYFGVPRTPPSGGEGRGSSGNPLRDFMLKSPDDPRPQEPTQPRQDLGPSHEPPFHGWTPFQRFGDILRPRIPENERKEDRDLDSAVSAGGLDQILTPPAGQIPQQPRSRSFFQSVVVTKVVKPDGSVEERRTVRDGQGNEETTVTRSGPDYEERPQPVTDLPRPFTDMRDDSLFSKFFGGFK